MPQTEPTGLSGLAHKNLAKLIANSTTFKGFFGGTEELALSNIYYNYAPSGTTAGVVIGGVSGAANVITNIATNLSVVTGTVAFQFIFGISDPPTLDDQLTEIRNVTDTILSEMAGLKEVYFDYNSIAMDDPVITNEDENPENPAVIIRQGIVTWGPSPTA